MARINPDLLGALQRKLKVGQTRVYTLIQQVASQHRVPRHLAALILAGDNGISFQKYATKQDLSELRGQAASGHSGASAPALAMPRSSVRRAKAKPAPRPKDNTVFVVHGRDEALRKSMFAFLRALGLKPMEWGDALATAKGANPQIESIIDSAMSKVQASCFHRTKRRALRNLSAGEVKSALKGRLRDSQDRMCSSRRVWRSEDTQRRPYWFKSAKFGDFQTSQGDTSRD